MDVSWYSAIIVVLADAGPWGALGAYLLWWRQAYEQREAFLQIWEQRKLVSKMLPYTAMEDT